MPSPTFKRAKIFGERNSGTHFLSRVVTRNFRCRMLRGTAGLSRAELVKALQGLRSAKRSQERERLTDERTQASLEHDFGWKHGCAPFDVLERNQVQAMHVLFMIIHKHPADWLKSLYHKPYNSLEPIRKMSFSEFLRHPWSVSAKENLSRSSAANPIDLWNTKHRSWLDLRTRGYNAIYVKNSDFLVSFEEAIAPLAVFLRRKNPAGPFLNVTKATKGSTDTIGELKRKYVETPPFDGYMVTDRQFVVDQLDHGIVAALGYRENSR
jgi:hypothetical protein